MGKIVRDGVVSDTSVDERRKTVREEQKVRTKKKKRKRDLTDLHQRLFKSKKDKETKIDGKSSKARSSKRISNRILPEPLAGIYRNGATGKEIRRSQLKLPLNDLNNARLQGNVLKLLDGYDSKSEGVTIENDNSEVPRDPLFDSTIRNILQPTPADEKLISPVLGKVDGKKRYQRNEYTEKKRKVHCENFRNSALDKYEELCNVICSENFEGKNFLDSFSIDPLTMVKKKLRSMYAESFRSQFLRDMIKRGVVLNESDAASTSTKNQFLPEIQYCPSECTQNADLISVTVDNSDSQLNYRKNKKNDNSQESKNAFLIPDTNFNVDGKRNKIGSSNLLFDLSLLNATESGMKNFVEPEIVKEMNNTVTDDDPTRFSGHSSMEANYSTGATRRDNNTVKYLETDELERTKEIKKPVFFVATETGEQVNYVHKRHLIKRKNQRTQTVHVLNNELKKHTRKQNSNVTQQVKAKNLKHIPAILRRSNTAVANNNNRQNLFHESMHINKEPRDILFDAASKRSVLFTPQSLITELDENSRRLQTSSTVNTMFDAADTKDLNVQTCVIASPSLRNDEVYFMKRSRSQPSESKQQPQNHHTNDIFVNRKNPPVQKTVMFTKKDSRNVGHCLYLNSLIADGTTNNSNVCIIRKNVPVQHEKSTNNVCTAHKNCQRVPENCYRAFHCSQNSDGSGYSSQEFKEASAPQMHDAQVHRKPMVCEKVLVRKVQQHRKCQNNQKCQNDQHVCYVVVDQCRDSNNMQQYSNDNVPQIEKYKTLKGGRFCKEDVADVGILKGVQNLKILPVEERESQMKFANSQCIDDTVVLEEQPIKYLAVENDSKTQKIPIYVQRNERVASDGNVEVLNPSVNYRVVSCPQESTQKIIFVPTCEQNKVLYVKQQNLPRSNISFEECSHPRKVVVYRPEVQCVKDSSNVCEVHVPKQNVVEIRKTECDTVVTNLQADNIKKSRRGAVNWEEVHYRPSREHDGCMRGQTVFYQK